MKKIAALVLALVLALTLTASIAAEKITIAVPNDPTNEGRALNILQDAGVLKLKDGAGITAAETAGEAYFVEGEYTFTATGGAGIGHRLSVPDGNGGWRTLQGFTAGGSYTYDKTADGTPPLVKIEWRVQKPFVMVVR